MSPVATSDAAFLGGACPTQEYTIAYTGNYTTSADASLHLRGDEQSGWDRRAGATVICWLLCSPHHISVAAEVFWCKYLQRLHLE
jgi:hypothetical protein